MAKPTVAKTAMEIIQEKFKVKVVKKEDDTRLSIGGEHFIQPGHPNHDGTEFDGEPTSYAVVPALVADELKHTNKNYHFSDPFLPGEEEKKK